MKWGKWRAAVAVAAVLIPTISIPSDVSSSVSDDATEREQVEGYIRSNFIWVRGNNPLWQALRGRFVFMDLRTGWKYRMKEGDNFKAEFADGSSVRFRFIGTVQCPSGLCFTWVMGSETPPTIVPPKPPIPRRTGGGEHPGKERGDHYVHTGGSGPLPGRPYDPYDPNQWATPRRQGW